MRVSNGKGLFMAAVLCAVTAGGVPSARAAQMAITDPAKPAQSFDKAWAQYESVRGAAGASIMERMMKGNMRLLTRMALDIFEGYPADPRRWNAAAEILQTGDPYVYGNDPKKTGREAMLRDNAGRVAWNAYAKGLYEQLVATPDVPAAAAKAGIGGYFNRLHMTFDAKPESLVPVVDEYARRFPGDPVLADMEAGLYGRLMEGNAGALADERLPKLLQSSNPGVRDFAQAKMLVKVGRNRPIDMKFTAVDGREVDLEKLRGKVVLIDFWATWCGPCMAEVPHLRKMYEQYHDQGFEIVGISFDGAPDASNPSAEQKSADMLRAFVKQKGMLWPNYYDGKAWGNEMGKKYAVKGLPTKFLLGKDGLLVGLNLHGEALESKVRELLASNGEASPGQAQPAVNGKASSGSAQPAMGRTSR